MYCSVRALQVFFSTTMSRARNRRLPETADPRCALRREVSRTRVRVCAAEGGLEKASNLGGVVVREGSL